MIGKLPLPDITEVLGGITDLRKDKPVEEGTLVTDDQLEVAPGQGTGIIREEGGGVTDWFIRPQDQEGVHLCGMNQLFGNIRQRAPDNSLLLFYICQATIGVIGTIHQSR
jgi:hypothetical protein